MEHTNLSNLTSNQEEFSKFFDNYVLLIEDSISTYNSLPDDSKPEFLNKIKDLVKVLSYLRGEGNVFPSIIRGEQIDKYYKLENYFYQKIQELENSNNDIISK